MALVGDPSPGGSFRPEPGDETVLTEYAEFPFPRDGARELMFLSRITTNDGNSFWMQARPEARFAIADDGTIESVLKLQAPAGTNSTAGSSARRSQRRGSVLRRQPGS